MPTQPPDYTKRLRFQLANLDALFADRLDDWSFDEYLEWLKDYKGRQPSTIDRQYRALRRMANHPVQPLKLDGTPRELVESFYEAYRYAVDVEDRGPGALKNDFEAVRSLGAFLGVPRDVWPAQPTNPRKERDLLPTPEEVHALVHADYTPNAAKNYENQLIKYLLVYDFGIGARLPSEAWVLKVGDFDPATHTIVITEPKKGSPRRRLLIEPEWLCCGVTRPSLAQYAEAWRPKVDVGGTDAFWLKPNGEPFPTPGALGRWLSRRVKKRFPWFYPYLGRTWTANARLIDWDFDYQRVAQWLGHDKADRLRKSYEQDARIHQRLYGEHWIYRAFIASSEGAAPEPGAATRRSGATPPVEGDGGGRVPPGPQEGRHPNETRRSRRSGAEPSRQDPGDGSSSSPYSSRLVVLTGHRLVPRRMAA